MIWWQAGGKLKEANGKTAEARNVFLKREHCPTESVLGEGVGAHR